MATAWRLQHFRTVHRSRRAEDSRAQPKTSMPYLLPESRPYSNQELMKTRRRWPLAAVIPVEQLPGCASPGTGLCARLSHHLLRREALQAAWWLGSQPEFLNLTLIRQRLRALTETCYLSMWISISAAESSDGISLAKQLHDYDTSSTVVKQQ